MDHVCDCVQSNGGFDEVTVGPSTNVDRESQCIICMEVISQDDLTFTHSACSYSTHRQCLLPWIEGQGKDASKTCPMCRQPYEFLKAFDKFQTRHAECLASTTREMLSTTMVYCTNMVNSQLIPPQALSNAAKLSISLQLLHWFSDNMFELASDVVYASIGELKDEAIEMLASGSSTQEAKEWIISQSLEIFGEISTQIHVCVADVDGDNYNALIEAMDYYNESICAGIDEEICRAWFESAFRLVMVKFAVAYHDRLESLIGPDEDWETDNGSDVADRELTYDITIVELADDHDDDSDFEITDDEVVTPPDTMSVDTIFVAALSEDQVDQYLDQILDDLP